MGVYFLVRRKVARVGVRLSFVGISSITACANVTEEDTTDSTHKDTETSNQERFEPLLRTFEHERLNGQVPGAALAVVQGGRLVLARGFGTKSIHSKEPVDENTLFRIGSVTKTLTATAVMQMLQEKRITLDAPITTVLSSFRFSKDETWAESISTRNLLTHTSGIVDGLRNARDPGYDQDSALRSFAFGEFAHNAYLMTQAGAFYNYSNPNYLLLGVMLETLGARDYPELISERVLRPLRMDRTVYRAAEVLTDGNYAKALTCLDVKDCVYPKDAIEVHPEDLDMAWIRPVAGAWSTVTDLAKLGQFLLQGNEEVLGTAYYHSMTHGQVNMRALANYNDYGFGVAISRGIFLGPDEFYAIDSRGHGGMVQGYSANVNCYPKLDFCLITLASTEYAFFPESLNVALRTLTQLPLPSPLPPVKVDHNRYREYTGTYEDRYSFGKVLISVRDDQLWVELPDLESRGQTYQHELLPRYSDTFMITVNNVTFPITFIPNSVGRYHYIRSRNAVAVRVDETSHVMKSLLE
jgi:CubicO group peptidase (beta-lactamase class C family)